MNTLETMRLDKWLWCARFYKTRSLATEEIGKGRVTVNGQLAKPARDLRCGDTVALRQGPVARTVRVRGRAVPADLRLWLSSCTKKPPTASPPAKKPQNCAAWPPSRRRHCKKVAQPNATVARSTR